ncbi:MAG TPA: putative Ig domain-containing protein, partial [Vicinamibacterales bacterium]|nr:putative Ig domain-containing protein [Vicinamibacterales bacterium]
FKVGSALTANVLSNVVLLNGANPCNVFFQVTSAATLNGTTFAGNVVARDAVTLGVGAALNGRALTTAAGAVTLSGGNRVGGCSAAVAVCPTITLTPAVLPGGMVAVAFSQTIVATGGVAPNSFAVTSGTLPAGLTLTAAGVLAGTPTAAGTFTFTVRGTDANGCFASLVFTVVIAAAPVPPPVCPVITILPASLPNGTVGVAFSQTLTGSGGPGPFTFGVTAGTLPAGLTLTPAGVLAGTPTAAGTSTATIRGTAANGCFAELSLASTIVLPVPVPTLPQVFFVLLASGLAALGYARLRQRGFAR